VRSREEAKAGILHGYEHSIRVCLFGADQQFACSLGHSAHRLDRVKEQIENYLLQLNAVCPNGRQAIYKFRLCGHAILCNFAARISAMTSKIASLMLSRAFRGGAFFTSAGSDQ
jgi:hypothetical protein